MDPNEKQRKKEETKTKQKIYLHKISLLFVVVPSSAAFIHINTDVGILKLKRKPPTEQQRISQKGKKVKERRSEH